jgi:hypothetical protein
MSESIGDYGGVKNDSSKAAATANIQAINDASEAADDNTVYLPEGTWYIGPPEDEWGGFALWAGNDNVNRGAAGLSFEGAGPDKTTLSWAWVKNGYGNGIRYHDQADHGDVTWKNLTYDGNYPNLTFGTDDTLQKGITAKGGVSSFSFQNVRIERMEFWGMIVETAGTLNIDRCSFYDISFAHGNRTGSEHSHPIVIGGSVDTTITNTEFELIMGSCVDMRNSADGALVMDTIYAEGVGVNLVKLNDAASIDLRHINHIGQTEALLNALDDDGKQEFRGDYFFRRIDSDYNDRVPVRMEHIRCRDLNWAFIRADGEAFDLSGGQTGPIAVEHTVFNGTTGAVEVTGGGDIDFDIGELSIHDVDGSPIWEINDACSGTVETFRWSADDELGDTNGVTISNAQQGASPFAPDVPPQSAVGADSGGNTPPAVSWSAPAAGDTLSGTAAVDVAVTAQENPAGSLIVEYRVDNGSWRPADYNTSTGYYQASWDTTAVADGSHTLDARATDSAGNTASAAIDVTTDNATAPLFDQWTPRWESDNSAWGVANDTSLVGDYGLVFDTDDSARHALSWDDAGQPSDVEILDKIRITNIPDVDGSGAAQGRLHLRSGLSTDGENGYWLDTGRVNDADDPSGFRLGKYTDGQLSVLRRFESIEQGTFYYRRFRAEGSDLRAKVWPASQSEPSTWDVTVTDTDHTAGWVGTGSYSATPTVETDVFSVATGGATADMVPRDAAPSVSWVTPADGTTLSGTASIQVAVSDKDDTADSLAVEYRVDDGTWTSVSYSSDTGYYEGSWDTTTVADGDHTLDARVTDSAGTTTMTSVSVTTDNTAETSSPIIDTLTLTEVETSASETAFDVDWQASGADAELESVGITLVDTTADTTEDSRTLAVSGATTRGTERLTAPGDDGSGHEYVAELRVTDTAGTVATATRRASETEETDAGNGPSINRFNVSEANRPDSLAAISVLWDVSAAAEDLATVQIEIADATGTVQSVTWSVTGTTAADMDAFEINNGDGKTFEATLTVTDAAGTTVSERESITA